MSSAIAEPELDSREGYETAYYILDEYEECIDHRFINTKWDVVHTLKVIEKRHQEHAITFGKFGADKHPGGTYSAKVMPYILALGELTEEENSLSETYKFIYKFKDCAKRVDQGEIPKQELIEMIPDTDETIAWRFYNECDIIHAIIRIAIFNRENGEHPASRGLDRTRRSPEETNFVRTTDDGIYFVRRRNVDSVHELWEKYEDQFDRDDYKDRTKDEDEFDWIPDNSDAGEGDSVENYNSHF